MTERMSRLPRWCHHLRAFLTGHFWAPCPLCGRMFGGHEWRDISGNYSAIPKPGDPGTGEGICPACTRAGHGGRLENLFPPPSR